MEKVKSRNWIITRNISDGELLDAQSWLSSLYNQTQANYVVGQLERGLDEGRDHIQAYINYGNGKRLCTIKKYCNKMHIEVCRDAENSQRYCLKELTRVAGPWEFGNKPLRRNNKDDWNEIYLLAKKRQFDDIPKSILVPHYNNLVKIAKDNMSVDDKTHLRGIFIHGESGVGKSLLARSLFPGKTIFSKSHNKWWDSYNDEQIVIWDDINPTEGAMSATSIKLYCDRYGIKGETKGSGVPLNHEFFIMTSQYSLEEVFTDEKDYAAIKRRTFVYHMVDYGLTKSQFSFTALKQHLFSDIKPEVEGFIRKDGDWDSLFK
jgi:hypothetical protein